MSGQRSMTTLLDHKTTLAYLAYLGYPDTPQTSAVVVTQPRRKDRKKGKVTRNVFLCYVCGAAGSGKTSLLRAFVGKPYRKEYEPTSRMISVVNSVDINGSERYLVVSALTIVSTPSFDWLCHQLQEFGSKYEPEVLRSSKKTDMVDLIVYVYDSSDTNSFSYISNLRVSCSKVISSNSWDP